MTENTRTLTYIGAAVVLLVAAGLINRKPVVESEDAVVDRVLFEGLKSPEAVAGLEIVTASADGAPEKFRVTRDSTGWSLPSHSNYPADAEKQVASAASSLIDLKVLDVVSKLPSEHATYGVLDPEKASAGAEGVGKLVNVLDKSGNSLGRLIIGKKDTRPSEDPEAGELRFVRAKGDAVYRVSLPTAKFSTNFADWIETDLLKLDPWDIAQVALKDYTIDVAEDPRTGQPVAAYEQASTIDLAFNDKDAKWSLKELTTYEDGEPKSAGLEGDEELNTSTLNALKSALDDLKIVDVSRKPEAMSSSLKADKSIFDNLQAMQSLRSRGFYVVGKEGGEPEILSSNGEVVVRMKDGVEYLLRFGGVAGVAGAESADSTESKSETSKDESAASEEKGTTLNRYIMVSANFNKELIPKPELEAVPGAAEDGKTQADTTDKTETGSEQAKKADESKSEKLEAREPASKGSPDSKATGDDKSSPKRSETEKDKSASVAVDAFQFVAVQDEDAKAPNAAKKGKQDQSEAKNSAATKEPEKATNGTKKQAQKVDSPKNEGAKQASDAAGKNKEQSTDDSQKIPDKAGDDAGSKKLSAEDKEELALERKRIQTENERKQKEYDEKIKKGEERARELNSRFADWYYVVSEETYRKIHLDRNAVIKKKAAETKDAANPDDGAKAIESKEATEKSDEDAGKE
jgi:hypothetical protein